MPIWKDATRSFGENKKISNPLLTGYTPLAIIEPVWHPDEGKGGYF